MSNTTIIVVGVPGAGKTTILDEIKRRNPSHFTIISFGTEMMQIAQKKFNIEDRDQMRDLPIQNQQILQVETAKKIKLIQRNILLDTHSTIQTHTGYIPGIPESILEILDPKAIILIDADEEEIHQRRDRDKSRPLRLIETTQSIRQHRIINQIFTATSCIKTNAVLKIILNCKGQVTASADEIIRFIRELR